MPPTNFILGGTIFNVVFDSARFRSGIGPADGLPFGLPTTFGIPKRRKQRPQQVFPPLPPASLTSPLLRIPECPVTDHFLGFPPGGGELFAWGMVSVQLHFLLGPAPAASCRVINSVPGGNCQPQTS